MSQLLTQTTTYLDNLTATPVWTSIGWTMWYYLWIGLIELLFACLILGILRRSSEELRYRFLLGLFTILLITPVIVFQSVSCSVPQTVGNVPLATTGLNIVWSPVTVVPDGSSEQFVEPDRMPNALQPPWKPEETQTSETSTLLLAPDSEMPRTIGQQAEHSTATFLQRLAALVPWFPVVWCIGSPLTLLCLGLGLIGAERYRREARVISAGSLFDQSAQLAARLGLRVKVFVGFSERIGSPILIGIFKPLILLPITAETGWTPAQLEMVLLHELAHVRRWDNLVNLLQRLAEGVLFFQPAIWIVSRWLTMEREHCCDALVVRVTGRAQDYATALAELAMAGHLPPGVVSAMARHPLLGRIRRILGHEQPLQVSRATLTLALMASLCCCAMAGLVRGVENKQQEQVGSKEISYQDNSAESEGIPNDQQNRVSVADQDTFEKRWQVVDVAGQPIPGVQVSIYSPSALSRTARRSDRALIQKQSSDSTGWVTFQLPEQPDYELELTKPGFLSVKLHLEDGTLCYWRPGNQKLANESSIEMMRCGTLVVTVLGVDGKPVPNYRLNVSNEFSSNSVDRNSKNEYVITDDQGKTTIRNLREGLVTLRPSMSAEMNATASHWDKSILISDGSKRIITVPLEEYSSHLEGSVVSETGQGLPGLAIQLERSLHLDDELKKIDSRSVLRIEQFLLRRLAFDKKLRTTGRTTIHSAITGADGKFRIQGLLPGEYIVRGFMRSQSISVMTSSGVSMRDVVPTNSQSYDPARPVSFHNIIEERVVLTPNETRNLHLISKLSRFQPQPVNVPDSVGGGVEDLRVDNPFFATNSNVDPQQLPTASGLQPKIANASTGNLREVTFRVTTRLGRPLPGVIANIEMSQEQSEQVGQLNLNQASDHTGRLKISLPADGVFDCSFQDYDGRRHGVDQGVIQTQNLISRLRIAPSQLKTDQEIPVIIARPGELNLELVLPNNRADSSPAGARPSLLLSGIHRVEIPGYGTPPSSLGVEQNLSIRMTSDRERHQTHLDGKGELLLAYPRGASSFTTYPTISTGLPRHLQPEPPMFSSKGGDPSNVVLGLSWVEVLPFDYEATETRAIDFNQCVCHIEGRVKDETGKSLPKVEIRVNRHVPAVSKEGPDSRDREIPIPVWDEIPRSNDHGEFSIERQQPGKVAIYAIQYDGKASETFYGELTPDKPVEINLVIDQSKPLSETPQFFTVTAKLPPTAIPFSPPQQVPVDTLENPLISDPSLTPRESAPAQTRNSVGSDNEITSREQLRYDGKSFEEWKTILRTEIKTDRVVESIHVMVFFATRGYEKEAIAEVAGVLRRMPPTHALRESMEFSRVMPASATALRLLGEASIPEMIKFLKSDNLKEVVVALEILSTKSQTPWDWEDSLPRPSSNWDVTERTYAEPNEFFKPVPVLENNVELTSTLKSLLKHPSSEVRGRILPASLGCRLSEAEIREILSKVLQDEDSAVWFSAVNLLGNAGNVQYRHEILVETYRALKDSGKLKEDLLRRKYYLMLIYCDTSSDSPDAVPFLSDLISDLAESNSPNESVYWLLAIRRFGNTSLSNEFVGREFEEKIEQLPDEEKERVQKTLEDMRVLLEQRWGRKIFKKLKPGESPISP